MILIYDTETTDKYNFKAPPLDPSQPRMVSLAALGLTDDGKDEIAMFYGIVRPDDFKIDNNSQAARVNGITHEYAMAYGMNGTAIMNCFLRLWLEAKVAIAFNNKFDNAIIDSELERRTPDHRHLFDKDRSRCAMMAASACMKMPNRYGYEGYAWPKLEEAYAWLFNQKMENAHNAMGDVRATGWFSTGLQQLNYWDIVGDQVLI